MGADLTPTTPPRNVPGQPSGQTGPAGEQARRADGPRRASTSGWDALAPAADVAAVAVAAIAVVALLAGVRVDLAVAAARPEQAARAAPTIRAVVHAVVALLAKA